jgi:hypothetical protein
VKPWLVCLAAGFVTFATLVSADDTEFDILERSRSRPLFGKLSASEWQERGRLSFNISNLQGAFSGACEKFWFPFPMWRLALGVPFDQRDFRDPFMPRMLAGTHVVWRMTERFFGDVGVEVKPCLTKRCGDLSYNSTIGYTPARHVAFSVKWAFRPSYPLKHIPSYEKDEFQPLHLQISLLL